MFNPLKTLTNFIFIQTNNLKNTVNDTINVFSGKKPAPGVLGFLGAVIGSDPVKEIVQTGLKKSHTFLQNVIFSAGIFAGSLLAGPAVGLAAGVGIRYLQDRGTPRADKPLPQKLVNTTTTIATGLIGASLLAPLGPVGIAVGAATGATAANIGLSTASGLTNFFWRSIGVSPSVNSFTRFTAGFSSAIGGLLIAIPMAAPIIIIFLFIIIISLVFAQLNLSTFVIPRLGATVAGTIAGGIGGGRNRNYPPATCATSPYNGMKYCFPIGNPNQVTWVCDHHDYAAADICAKRPCTISPDVNLPIYAFTDGIVTWADPDGVNAGGIGFIQKGDDGVYYYYTHNKEMYVAKNDRLTAGELVGIGDTTGNAVGTWEHLHFGASDWYDFRTINECDDPGANPLSCIDYLAINMPHFRWPQYYMEKHLEDLHQQYPQLIRVGHNRNCVDADYGL